MCLVLMSSAHVRFNAHVATDIDMLEPVMTLGVNHSQDINSEIDKLTKKSRCRNVIIIFNNIRKAIKFNFQDAR